MCVCEEASFPYGSSYNETDQKLTIDDWVWYRKEENIIYDEFSFDSEAERRWAEILKDIRQKSIKQTDVLGDNKFLWGKNFGV